MNKHCWHATAVTEESTSVVCCFCGTTNVWRGDHEADHGIHLPKIYAPVVLFQQPTCTWKQEETQTGQHQPGCPIKTSGECLCAEIMDRGLWS